MQVWKKRTKEVLLVVKLSAERGQRRWQPEKGGVYEVDTPKIRYS